MLCKAIELIERQQGTREKNPHLWMMGEQLKDICRADARAAELVAQDLQVPEMRLDRLQKKFDDYARQHKVGNQSVITPAEGETLIREFFGLGKARDHSTLVAAPETEAAGNVVSLFDLI